MKKEALSSQCPPCSHLRSGTGDEFWILRPLGFKKNDEIIGEARHGFYSAKRSSSAVVAAVGSNISCSTSAMLTIINKTVSVHCLVSTWRLSEALYIPYVLPLYP